MNPTEVLNCASVFSVENNMIPNLDVDELSVVNACLATMGESGLLSLEEDHSMKEDARALLVRVNADLQKDPFWFNSETLRLLPDATSKFIYIPQDVIRVMYYYSRDEIVQRGRRLYNKKCNTYEFTGEVCIDVVRLLPYEDLPYHAAAAVRDETVMRFQHSFDGDQARYRQLGEIATLSRAQLVCENIRQRRSAPLNRALMALVVDGTNNGPGFMEPIRRIN
jgi:hypothetical protein